MQLFGDKFFIPLENYLKILDDKKHTTLEIMSNVTNFLINLSTLMDKQ